MKHVDKTFAFFLLLFTCITAQESDVSAFNRTMQFVNITPIWIMDISPTDANINNFLYGYCSVQPTLNCTIIMETPTSNNKSTSKVCNIQFPDHDVDDSVVEILMRLTRLDGKRVLLRNPHFYGKDGMHVNYTFINMDTCSVVDRHIYTSYLRYYNASWLNPDSVIVRRDSVEFLHYESSLCGELRNCSISMDFDGNEKKGVEYLPFNILSMDDESLINKYVFKKTLNNGSFIVESEIFNESALKIVYFDKNQDEKLIYSRKVNENLIYHDGSYARNGDFFGLCGCSAHGNNESNFKIIIICSQYDNRGNLKFNTTVELGGKDFVISSHNLPDGGLLVFSTECEILERSHECKGFKITKISSNGHQEGSVTAATLYDCDILHTKNNKFLINISDNGDDCCIYTTCFGGRVPQHYEFLYDLPRYLGHIKLRNKCISWRSFNLGTLNSKL